MKHKRRPFEQEEDISYRDVYEEKFAKVMKNAGAEYEAMMKEARREKARQERQETAVRQLLLFLIFFIIVNLVIFRDQIGSWLLSLDETMGLPKTERVESKTESTRHKIKAISLEAERREQMIKDIGFGDGN